MFKEILLTLALLLMSTSGMMTTPALAADKSDIVITQAQARASMGKMPRSAAFLQIENKGKAEDTLLSATSSAAEQIEIHNMSMEGDVMKMRVVDSITIKSGAKVEMKPGQGYHLMLMGLNKPLKAGDKIPVTLTFRQAGKMKVTVDIVEMGMPAKPVADMHEHHEHHEQ